MFLGEDLPSYLLLAFGAALAVGNLAALIRPRPIDPSEEVDASPSELGTVVERPPLGRALIMILIGTVAAVWALVSLIS